MNERNVVECHLINVGLSANLRTEKIFDNFEYALADELRNETKNN